ncbi:hypothetical protein ACEN8I_11720 [Polaromonas sp. CT11-55]|uniref:hypothetical protein n=1 Tax=Polaromonas sp. CT11-55 TaxID=3243045 RepID=UPI0039A66357
MRQLWWEGAPEDSHLVGLKAGPVLQSAMRLRTIIILSITLPLGACVSFNNLKSAGELRTSPDEGVVIIGAPAGTKLVVHSGSAESGKFVADGFLPDGIIGTADDGFLVRKLRIQKPGRGYALVSIISDKSYSANCGQNLAMFTVKPGEIQYITTFAFNPSGDRVGVSNTSDLPSAAGYIKAKFPEIAREVIQGDVGVIEQGRCQSGGGVNYIPIYMPRRR